MDNQAWRARKTEATPKGIGVMCDFYTERARNAEIWDVQGRRYIDFAAGIAVTNTGHCHPKIVAAMQRQLEKFTHTAFQISPYSSYVELAEKLHECAPGNHKKKTAFFTTGAETSENAVKQARAATGRPAHVQFTRPLQRRTL